MIWNKEVESKASKLVGLMQALALNVPAGSLWGECLCLPAAFVMLMTQPLWCQVSSLISDLSSTGAGLPRPLLSASSCFVEWSHALCFLAWDCALAATVLFLHTSSPAQPQCSFPNAGLIVCITPLLTVLWLHVTCRIKWSSEVFTPPPPTS